MHRSRLILLSVLGWTLVAEAGSVRTRTDQIIEGQIAIVGGSIRVVTPQGKIETVPLAQLKQALFDASSPIVPVAPATNSPVAFAITNAVPHGTVPIGVLTWGGAFFVGGVVEMDDSVVRLAESPAGFTLTTANTAAIFFQPITPYRANTLRSGRSGVLLVTGDFVEGKLKSIENGSIKLTSVLFGERKFEMNREATAVVLQKPALAGEQFEVRLRDGSALFARDLRAEADTLILVDPFLRDLRLPVAKLEEISFGKTTNRLAAAWAAWEMLTEIDRQRAAQQENLITKIASYHALRWRARTQLFAQARAASKKAAERSLSLTNAQRNLVIAEEFSRVALAAVKQAGTNVLAKDKTNIELRHKSDLLSGAAKDKANRGVVMKTELERATAKTKLDHAVAESAIKAQRLSGEIALKAAMDRLKSASVQKEIAEKLLAVSKKSVAQHSELLEEARKKLIKADQDVATHKEIVAILVDLNKINRLPNAKEAEKKPENAAKREEAKVVSAAATKSLASMQGVRVLADARIKELSTMLMRFKTEEGSCAKILAGWVTTIEKIAGEIVSVQNKANADVMLAEMKRTKVIADGEKLLTELQAKLKEWDTAKAALEKAATEALLAAEKALTEKNAAYNAMHLSRAAFIKAEAEVNLKRTLFNEEKLLAERGQVEKMSLERTLAEQSAGGLPK